MSALSTEWITIQWNDVFYDKAITRTNKPSQNIPLTLGIKETKKRYQTLLYYWVYQGLKITQRETEEATPLSTDRASKSPSLSLIPRSVATLSISYYYAL